MDDVNEAKKLIEKIRRARRVDENEEEDANAADLLSEELYSKPSHFILELIQNSDDNKYASDVIPKLQIVYREDGFLFIGSNEVGFTAANVQAICRIACSTKKVEGSQKGYIGEKGIGFKAVFKVADMVWIKSGALSFAFDKTKPLGMIAPQWTEFPAGSSMNERTMFCFRIPEQEHREIVAAHLLELKPELLIFLRQLKKVEITMQDKAGKIEQSFSLAREDDQVSSVRRTTLRHVITHPNAVSSDEQFLVFRDTKTGMPREKKREKVTESDVLMAFPVSGSMQPVLSDRRTFNYLPIRSYGLPFVLQGDFMLSASREDILQQNKWNDAIVDATIALFAKCIEIFNAENLLKYMWPRYAKSQGNAYGTIFQGFFNKLCTHLRSEKVLLSQTGSLEAPSSLVIVPPHYMDGEEPLVAAPGSLRTYISPSYQTHDLSDLQILKLSPGDFFNTVGRYAEFAKQSEAWHIKLTKALLRDGPKFASNMPLIPMNNGKWITPKQGKFYFPEVEEGMSIPSGIEVAMISSDVKDPDRRKLFAELGASKLSVVEVFELILKQHRDASHDNKTWSCEQAVEHALFLYQAPSRPRSYDLSRLQFFGTDEELHLGEYLYMDDPDSPPTMSSLFGASNDLLVFIHPRYFQEPASGTRWSWREWLKNEVGLYTRPILTCPGYDVSLEFHWLIKNKASSVWLQLLKDNVTFYDLPGHSYKTKTSLSNALVTCRDGLVRKLRNVYLPLGEITSQPYASAAVPFLDVKQPEDKGWQALKAIGLRIRPDIAFYLAILKSMPSLSPSPSLDEVKSVYRKIQGNSFEDSALVRSTFENMALIFIASSTLSRWVSLSECRWTANPALGLHCLRTRYQDFRDLFQLTLQVKNADAVDIVNELDSVNDAHNPAAKAERLLTALTTLSSLSSAEHNAVQSIEEKAMKIFPIMDAGSPVRLCSALDDKWYIADRQRLHEAFKGKIGLLHFETAARDTVSALVELLNLENRCLGNLVQEETKADGAVVYESELTDMVRSKAVYLAQLADVGMQDTVREQLTALEIYSCPGLSLHWSIPHSSGTIYGQPEQGFVITQKSAEHIRVTISAHAVSGKSMPWSRLADELLDACNINADDKKRRIMQSMLAGDEDIIKDELWRASLICDMSLLVESSSEFPGEGPNDHAVVSAGASIVHEMSNTEPFTGSIASTNGGTFAGLAGSPSAGHSISYKRSSNSLSDRAKKTKHVDIAAIAKAGAAFSLSTLGAVTGGVSQQSNPKNDRYTNETLQRLPSSRHATLGSVVFSPSSGESTEYQQQIGFGGEVYIYELLKKQFGITWECWTGHLREQYDLPPFTEFEGGFADFTIRDLAICKKMTEWLTAAGSADMKRWEGREPAYHFEAKRYHESDSDLYVILRVYKLGGEAGVLAYVDPYGMMLTGKLSFEARDGYEVHAI
ncbi:hypothetical protein KC331_g156 [Hortaea werneckii]|nr:hypothetical protein KC331_g156 [Hortaea werneckii]KAI7721591.1 hypothetical protein KC353_g1227 [Hortaea werneckii]